MTAVAVGSAALFWLLRDHWGHTLGALPYLLFLACPLMHLFMHRGHGNGHHHHDLPPQQDEPTARPGS
ncbi:MAG: DUF2933 domain-containing protein [Caulobacter sp.]